MTSVVDGRGPDVDTDLLLTHLEYASWAREKTLVMVDKLPPTAITQPVDTSFPTLLATLQHVYGWDKYYFIHMQGGQVERESIGELPTYSELKHEWAKLHHDMIAWARANLATRKVVVLEGWGMWPTWMIVMQIANHATHHFGQVVTLLRQLGYTPHSPLDFTDLITFYLRRYPQENQKEWLKPLLE